MPIPAPTPPHPSRPLRRVLVVVVTLAAVLAVVVVMLTTAVTVDAQEAEDEAEPGPEVVTGPADRLPPRPLEVTTAEEPPEDEVAFTDAVVWMELEPGIGGQPEIRLVNGGEGSVSLALEARPVAAAEDGSPIPLPGDTDGEGGADTEGDTGTEGATDAGDGDGDAEADAASPLPDASGWVVLAEDEVHLDPGEEARIRPVVAVPDDADDGAFLAALTATATGAAQPLSIATLLVASVGDVAEAPVPEVTADFGQEGSRAELTIRLAAVGSVDAVDGTVRIRGWWGGTVASVDLPAVLLLPETPRALPIEVSSPWLPGRYTADVEVVGRAGEAATTEDSAWLWRWEVAAGSAAILLLVALTLLAVSVRRRRSARAVPSDVAAGDDAPGSGVRGDGSPDDGAPGHDPPVDEGPPADPE